MDPATASIPSLGITPRSPRFAFDDSVPRHWFGGNAMATHIANGVNLLFPAGERFFVRAVRHYLDRIDDETLRAQVKAFFSQEGQHANAHEKFFRTLEAQGYPVRSFLETYERIAFKGIERVSPPALRLAVTVALEHYTAIMAENALTERLLDHAHPALRGLLMWHAAEEIEHKAVAFDVLRAVHPSYALRIAGLVVATCTLVPFWIAATLMFLREDKRNGVHTPPGALRDLDREHPIGQRVFARGIREYLRRDFHPSQNDTAPLARAYLAEAGLASS